MRRVAGAVTLTIVILLVATALSPSPVQACIECEKCKHTFLLSRCWWVGAGETGRCDCRQFLNNCYAEGPFCEIIVITP